MTTAILPTLLSQPSGQHLAYARATIRSEDLAELLASMANASGGMIVIGINPRTLKPEGVGDAERHLLEDDQAGPGEGRLGRQTIGVAGGRQRAHAEAGRGLDEHLRDRLREAAVALRRVSRAGRWLIVA